MTTPLIQAIARAMADEMKSNHVYVSDDLSKCLVDGGLFDLHDVAQAALTAITEEGYVIVPHNPTPDMVAAGGGERFWRGGPRHAYLVWWAMISAAQGDGE